MRWRFGAVRSIGLVDLPAESRRTQGLWKVTKSGSSSRQVCCVLPSGVKSASSRAALIFYRDALSITAGWMGVRVGGKRRAIVSCRLRSRSAPAIAYFSFGTA